jgi:hypothetical protein
LGKELSKYLNEKFKKEICEFYDAGMDKIQRGKVLSL